MNNIIGISISKNSYEFIIHINNDNDYYFITNSNISMIIYKIFE